MMARRIIASRRRAAGGDAPLLSLYPGAAAAYSLRDLIGLNPDLILVRRSTDNAEQAFSASGISDGSLEAWCGSGDGFVRTWYDQSGNGNDATQATASSQPKIVDGGVLVTENGKAALDFDGVGDFLLVADKPDLRPSSVSIFFTSNSIFDERRDWVQSGDAGTYPTNNFIFGSGKNTSSFLPRLPENNFNEAIETKNAVYFFAASNATNSFEYRQNGLIIDSASGVTIGTDDISGLSIGSKHPRIAGMHGTVYEIIIYPSDQSANREAIESNINGYYGIY